MKKVPQKYYFGYEDKEVEILTEFVDKEYKIKWCVVTAGDRIFTTTKSELKKLEETNHYKRKKQMEKEIEDLKNTKKDIIESYIKEAVKSLEARIRLNLFLGSNDSKVSASGLYVLGELEKIMREKVGDNL